MSKEEKNIVERIDQLIRLEATGNPKELADKLLVSERTIYNLIKKIKEEYEAPIIFDSYKNSYIYTTRGKIILKFQSNLLKEENLNKITGGNSFIFEKEFFTAKFLQSDYLDLQ